MTRASSRKVICRKGHGAGWFFDGYEEAKRDAAAAIRSAAPVGPT